ncbi:MAG: ATP-binding cassette domain-containing protein [Anaerolineae bacterium]|nr:ATP-binding cassette domain-containing protein [Anaerolineae bacterium]
MEEVLITCDNLSHVYSGGVVAVKEVNLKIRRGELIGIIGQNGSGKTTLVKHFNGLLKPTYGKVIIKGEETTNKRVQELSRSVGYVFQNPNHQLFAKTVTAELEFGPRNLGLSEEEVHERVEKAIEFFNLDTYRDQHPYRISFPLRKLVGMASIYTMRPDVFILDEPTTGQDNITTRIVYQLIRRLRDEGSTVICVAHDMILLAEVVERMIVMRDSVLIADTDPKTVFSDRKLMSSTHLYPPQITELSHRLKDKNFINTYALSIDEMQKVTDQQLQVKRSK